MITDFLQFKSCKFFSSLIVINREENSTLLEQLICRDPGSNEGLLDLQSNALPTELSRIEKRTTDFLGFPIFAKIFFLLHNKAPWKTKNKHSLYWILITLLEFSVPSADPH